MITALTGMNVPAAETSPEDSALSAADNSPAVTAQADEESPLLNFRVGSDPIELARQIREQIEAAAQLMEHQKQVDSLNNAMSHTQFLLTGESEIPETATEEPETESIPETETELPAEAETESQVWPLEMGDALQAGSVSDEEADDAGETIAETETELTTEAAQAAVRPGRGLIAIPDLQSINIARVSLYDYRMLRTYPLAALPKDLHRLYDQAQELVSGFEGDWSVFVQNLSTGQTMVMNDKPMNSASVMKLFIMETVYEAFENKTMTRDEDMVYLLRSMIINSSNDSSNRLLEILGNDDLAAGVGLVNEFIQEHGYTPETAIYNGFQDPNTVLDPDHPNMVRARDVGLLLSRVYNRQFISRKVCNEIEQMMLDQATRYKIPRGVPDGVQVGNKSGETSDTANDAAFVYGPTADYILVVLSHGWTNENAANENVVKVSQLVYNFFEG